MAINNLQRHIPTLSFKDRVAPRAERPDSKGPHGIFIFHEQDRALAGEVRRRGFFNLSLNLCRRFFLCFEIARQIDAEGRAFIDSREGKNIAAGLLDDPIDRGKAKTRPLTHIFGSEERLEDLTQMFFRNTAACVRHFDQDIFSRWHQCMIERLRIFSRDIGRTNGEPSAIFHGIARIHSQVDHHLLELVLIHLHKAQVPLMGDLELHRFTQKTAQQV